MEQQENHLDDVKSEKDLTSPPAISIPGMDKITGISQNKIGTKSWALILFICTAISLYQIVMCCLKYYSGDPAIETYYEDSLNVPLATGIICPSDLFGKNVLTEKLRKRYRELYNISNDEEIYFSDFLRLPGMTVNKLWDIQKFNSENVNVTFKSGATRNDTDRIQKIFEITNVATSSGTCLVLKTNGMIPSFGRSTYLKIRLPPIPKDWNVFDLYIRAFFISIEENPTYQKIQDGIAILPWYSADVSLSIIKIMNLDLPSQPCKDSIAVEKCRDECMENLLFTSLSCRLPYLNTSLPECNSPQLFNESFMASIEIMKKKPDCIKNCPRKCQEYLFTFSADVLRTESEEYFKNFYNE